MPLGVIFGTTLRIAALASAAALAVAGLPGCDSRPAGRPAGSAAGATAPEPVSADREASPGPSVILVVVDTLRADHVGAVQRDGDRAGTATPRLDDWAAAAVRFRRAVSPAPFTMPAVAALLTGVYPDRTGVAAHEAGTTLRSWRGDTLAEAAQRAGLRTAAVVANPWLARETTGFERGFDEFVRLYQPGQAAGASAAEAVTKEAIRMLDAAGDGRVFVWAHYFDPHMPYTPPADLAGYSGPPSRVMTDFDAKTRDLAGIYRGEGYSQDELAQARSLYEGEVRHVDREIGRLLDHVEKSGRAGSTIVVVAADHGESLGEHGLFFAHDYTLYDELVRVPLLVKIPGGSAAVRDDEVSLIDVAPTLCRAAGLACKGSFDGRDLFGASPPRTLFAASTPMRRRGPPYPRLEVRGLGGRWTMALADSKKLIRIPRRNGLAWESYDLARDPREERPSPSDASRKLAADLGTWMREMHAARPPEAKAPPPEQQRRDDESLRSLGYLD
jgi:arylsulfatase A-like enzyme